MIAAECTCTSGSFFWHEEGCAALPPKVTCTDCGHSTEWLDPEPIVPRPTVQDQQEES